MTTHTRTMPTPENPVPAEFRSDGEDPAASAPQPKATKGSKAR